MDTAALKIWSKATLLLAVMLILVACDKKCQPPAPAPPATITANPWRMVSTTNPSIKNLDRFTFLIMSFKSDFAGDILKVVNNKQFDTPILTFKYNIETTGKTGQIRAVFSTVVATEGGDAQPGEESEPIDYNYQLKTRLTLTEVKTGYSYEYVPFVGIVDPDSTCTF